MIQTFEEFSLNESNKLDKFEKALKGHDFYYDMSDDMRKWDKGEKSEKDLEKLYHSLSPEEQEHAIALMTDGKEDNSPSVILANRFKGK